MVYEKAIFLVYGKELIIKKYTELDLKKHLMINKDDTEEVQNLVYLYENIKQELLKINNDKYYITDVLIEFLYKIKKSNYKTTLWECFGDVIIENLKNNVDENYILCEKCGNRIEITTTNNKYCNKCYKEMQKQWQRESMKKLRKSKKSEGSIKILQP